MYAISAASVAFAVTRACSSGELEKCGCDHNVHGSSPEGRFPTHQYTSIQIVLAFCNDKPCACVYVNKASSGQAAVITLPMEWPFLSPLWMCERGVKASPPAGLS